MTMPRLLLCAACLVLPLAACDRSDDTPSLTINADGGNVAGALDARSGEVKVNVPGFSGQFKLPKLQIDTADFDLNGVRLYPGSTIEAMDVGSGRNDGVRIRFRSPATPDQVRGWFQERLAKAGFTITRDGRGLTGTTEEDKPFRLELDGDGSDRAKGTIVLGS
ncbi:hypothetical protein M9979_08065 [Sphingomonas sp. RP10(2022)]|uniref:Lipoprotein n=1 Tax=Sphingomonas liriopis TaxID=2949094 RepID=A0A9X2HWQ8_9SPHN|nr:hypothetical protein [Sphingomonas liriopis]MCP3734824.1 hypothetical protein [Sphingomonas liriopis]